MEVFVLKAEMEVEKQREEEDSEEHNPAFDATTRSAE